MGKAGSFLVGVFFLLIAAASFDRLIPWPLGLLFLLLSIIVFYVALIGPSGPPRGRETWPAPQQLPISSPAISPRSLAAAVKVEGGDQRPTATSAQPGIMAR
ncbi:MAG: hypothetical protein WA761_09260 [Thermoplasmata archaeon]